MSKRNKKLLSLLLSTMMVFSVVPSTVYAAPDQEAEATVEQDANEEVKQEDTVNNEADASADQTDTKQDEAKADDTAQKTDNAATQAGNAAQTVVDGTDVTVAGTSFTMPVLQLKGANAAVAEAMVKDVKIDETDPAIQGLRKALENLEIAGGEGEADADSRAIATYANETEVKQLSQEQINTVVGMYKQYLDYWAANANVLGVQNPFFLNFNDNGKDGLGALGEMLALDGKSVQDVRDGKVSYDDLTGMITTFIYGDRFGVNYYGEAVEQARTDVLNAIDKSGAKTDAQKLLVINDWLAHHNTFDMAYIMNSGKVDADKPMWPKDENNVEKVDHQDDVYNAIYADYKPQIEKNFRTQIQAAVEKNLLGNFYKQAIVQVRVAGGQSEEDAKAYVEAHKTDIENNPEAFVKTNLPDAADSLKEQADEFMETARTDGVEVDPVNAPGVKMTVDDLVEQQM